MLGPKGVLLAVQVVPMQEEVALSLANACVELRLNGLVVYVSLLEFAGRGPLGALPLRRLHFECRADLLQVQVTDLRRHLLEVAGLGWIASCRILGDSLIKLLLTDPNEVARRTTGHLLDEGLVLFGLEVVVIDGKNGLDWSTA